MGVGDSVAQSTLTNKPQKQDEDTMNDRLEIQNYKSPNHQPQYSENFSEQILKDE